MTTLTESTVEAAALEWLETIEWQVAHGPDIAPDTLGASGPTTARWYWKDGCSKPWLD